MERLERSRRAAQPGLECPRRLTACPTATASSPGSASTRRRPADAHGLRTLHRAYLAHLPYDTLAIHLAEFVVLDLDGLAERVMAGGRGGYCFEFNGLLAWLLEELGFEVERREARVGARDGMGPTNHLALVASVPGRPERWLVDAGLGESDSPALPRRSARIERRRPQTGQPGPNRRDGEARSVP